MPLGDVADATIGKTPRRADYRDTGRYRIVKYRDLAANGLDFGETKDAYVVDEPSALRGLRGLESGDILIGASGHDGSTVGRKLALVDQLPGADSDPTFFVGELLRIRPRTSETDSRWLLHYFSSAEGFRALQHAVSGGHLTNGRARQIPVPMAPPDVQESLSDLLDGVRGRAASASKHLAGAGLKIERFRQAILAAACSGRLTTDWRDVNSGVEHGGALAERSRQELAARGRRTSAAEQVAVPDWLSLPDSWSWSPLRDLAEIRAGIQKQPKRTPMGNDFPYLRVANVRRGRLNLSEVHRFELFEGELQKYRLEPGDLLVVEGNGSANEIGRCALWNGEIPNCVHQNHIIRARFIEMLPRFVELFWNSPIASREIASLAVTSAGLYSLSARKIGSVPIPVAPLDEQSEVVRRVDELLAVAHLLAGRVERAARRFELSSQAILAKVFRGELAMSGAVFRDE